jgi:hypothetical protein
LKMSESLLFSKVCKCPECKKVYERTCVAEEWGWRMNKVNYCSYTCMRTAERRIKAAKKRHRFGLGNGVAE